MDFAKGRNLGAAADRLWGESELSADRRWGGPRRQL